MIEPMTTIVDRHVHIAEQVVFIAGLHSLIGWEILEGDDLVFPIMLGLWIWIDEFQIIRRIKPEQE